MASSLLLTGATGFFGKALLRHWHHAHDSGLSVPEVTALSRCPDAFARAQPELANASWLRWHQGDILCADGLPSDLKFDLVLHAAADSTLGAALPALERYDQIVSGTRNVLDLAVKTGAKRFLLTSSGAAYGPQPLEMACLSENCACAALTTDVGGAYGSAKRAAEHLCSLYAARYGIEVTMARCFAFAGRDLPLDAHFAIGNFVRDALWRDCIQVTGDPCAVRTYMDQQDLAWWLLHSLIHGRSGEIYNVGGAQSTTIAQLASLVRQALAPEKTVSLNPTAKPSAMRSRYVPCVQKAQEELGLSNSYTLTEIIHRMALPYRNCTKT